MGQECQVGQQPNRRVLILSRYASSRPRTQLAPISGPPIRFFSRSVVQAPLSAARAAIGGRVSLRSLPVRTQERAHHAGPSLEAQPTRQHPTSYHVK